MKMMDFIDLLLDTVLHFAAWAGGLYLVLVGRVQEGILALILAFIIEHVVVAKMVRKGYIKGSS